MTPTPLDGLYLRAVGNDVLRDQLRRLTPVERGMLATALDTAANPRIHAGDGVRP